jgi:hypothetical protein
MHGLAQQMSERGPGIMYRAIDCGRLFEQSSGHNIGSGDPVCGVELQDGYWKRLAGTLNFESRRVVR